MRLEADAAELGRALSLVALGLSVKTRVKALAALRLDANDDALTIASNILDHRISATVRATVHEAGAVAPPGAPLAALIADMVGTAAIESEADSVTVRCGRGRYVLPSLPAEDLPAPLAMTDAIGIDLAATDLLRALETTAATATPDHGRPYLRGVHLRNDSSRLIAVGTDGSSLARVALATGEPPPPVNLIVPLESAELAIKLLKKSKAERAVLRCGRSLIEVQAAGFGLTSKLIDAKFPDYRRVIPMDATHLCETDRDEFAAALARLAALAERLTVVRLAWNDGEGLALSLADCPDTAADTITAEVTGECVELGARLDHLRDLLDRVPGDRVRIAARDAQTPITITNPTDDRILALLSTCALRGCITNERMKR